MDTGSSLSAWMFFPEGWLILAIVLVIADILIGMDFFVLSVGIASLIVSGLLWTQQAGAFGGFEFFGSWRQIVLCFAVLSLGSVGLIKFAFQKKKAEPDINDY